MDVGVPYVVPDIWDGDTKHCVMFDVFLGDGYVVAKQHIERRNKSAWISIISCSWYEFSLAGTINTYRFDFENHRVRFYDGGTAHMNTSTSDQIGRAVTRLLSLTESRAGAEGDRLSFSDYMNKFIYVYSFVISQRDMFASVLRLMNTNEFDRESRARNQLTVTSVD